MSQEEISITRIIKAEKTDDNEYTLTTIKEGKSSTLKWDAMNILINYPDRVRGGEHYKWEGEALKFVEKNLL